MPLLPNAKKALRVSKRKTAVNSRVKSIVKTMVDKVKKAPSAQSVSDAYSALDTAVKQNLLHKNKVARVKSQLSKLAKPEKKASGGVKTGSLSQKVAKKAPAKKVAKTAPSKPAATLNTKKGGSKKTAQK